MDHCMLVLIAVRNIPVYDHRLPHVMLQIFHGNIRYHIILSVYVYVWVGDMKVLNIDSWGEKLLLRPVCSALVSIVSRVYNIWYFLSLFFQTFIHPCNNAYKIKMYCIGYCCSLRHIHYHYSDVVSHLLLLYSANKEAEIHYDIY